MARSIGDRLFPPPPLPPDLARILEKNGGLGAWLSNRESSDFPLIGQKLVEMRRRLDEVELEFYANSPRVVYLGITQNTAFNAFAYASSNDITPPFDFIAINHGVIFTILDVFLRMLARPDILVDIGNATLETELPPALAYLSTDAMRAGNAMHVPLCPIRQQAASILSSLAINFLLFHEATHLTNGHVDFKRSLYFDGSICEAVNERASGLSKQLSQALELDADMGGFELLAISCFVIRKTLDSRIANGASEHMAAAMRAIYSDPNRLLGYAQFSAYMCFRLFDVNWVPDVQHESSHPFSAVRMYWTARMPIQVAAAYERFGASQKIYEKINLSMVREAEHAFAKLLGEQPNYSMLASVDNSNQYLEYFKELAAEWNRIRPELEMFKRGGRLRGFPQWSP